MDAGKMKIVVREFDIDRDRPGAEDVDRACEVRTNGKMSLFTDLLGDPVCRIRNSPAFLMLIAEAVSGPQKLIVGLIRGCIKVVTCDKKTPRNPSAASSSPIYTKLGYILGLRVSPNYQRNGIGFQLVDGMETWFRTNGAEYSYMATDKDNAASVRLFIGRCGYLKFRTPSILVNPVFAHHHPLRRSAALRRLSPADAELLYRHKFSTVEFFPNDIDDVLNNPLTVATVVSVPAEYKFPADLNDFLTDPPESWAVASVWDSKYLFHLEVKGASRILRGFAAATRAADRAAPWLRIPSVPDIFRPFGMYVMYGVGGEGPAVAAYVRDLCQHAHNLARSAGCGVVAAEVAPRDPIRSGIPHWSRLSYAEDLWCVKRIAEDYSDDGAVGDWTKSPPGDSIFVDPREV